MTITFFARFKVENVISNVPKSELIHRSVYIEPDPALISLLLKLVPAPLKQVSRRAPPRLLF